MNQISRFDVPDRRVRKTLMAIRRALAVLRLRIDQCTVSIGPKRS